MGYLPMTHRNSGGTKNSTKYCTVALGVHQTLLLKTPNTLVVSHGEVKLDDATFYNVRQAVQAVSSLIQL